MKLVRFMLAAALLLSPTISMAQAPVAAQQAGGVINIGQALGPILQPYVDAVVQAILASLVGWVLWLLKTKLNVTVDAAHRDAITAAVQRQASSLVADGFVKVEQNGKITVNDQAKVQAANAVLNAVPDALNRFGLDVKPDVVAARIVDMLPQVPAVAQAQAAAIAPPA